MNEEIRPILSEIIEKLKNEYNPIKVILFGSHAYGTPTKDSDLDILVVKDNGSGFIYGHKLIDDFTIPVQIIFISGEEFQETKDVIGGIAFPASKYGMVVYEKS